MFLSISKLKYIVIKCQMRNALLRNGTGTYRCFPSLRSDFMNILIATSPWFYYFNKLNTLNTNISMIKRNECGNVE